MNGIITKKENGIFVSVYPDYTLAAQGNTSEEAEKNLMEQISEYEEEANTIDLNHRDYLVSRNNKTGWMSEDFQRGIVGAMNYCHRHRDDCKHGKSPKLCWKCFRILIKKILLKIRLNNDFRKNSTKN